MFGFPETVDHIDAVLGFHKDKIITRIEIFYPYYDPPTLECSNFKAFSTS